MMKGGIDLSTVLSIVFTIAYISFIFLSCYCIYKLFKFNIKFKVEFLNTFKDVSQTLKSYKK